MLFMLFYSLTLATPSVTTTLGSIHYFLGFEAHRTSAGIYLTQSKYALDLLGKADMMDCKPSDTPMNSFNSLTDEGEVLDNPSLYRTIIGSLQYLTYTRPDISFVVNKHSQFLSSPKQQHWVACKRLLRYVNGTLGLGLFFAPAPDLPLVVYTNADHAGCKVSRRSTSGICVLLGQNLIVWSSQKKTVVAQSVGEAEYRAIAPQVTEILWLQSLLSKLGYSCGSTPIVWSDNMAAKSIAENPVFHSRTKHIEIDVHFVRENVESGAVKIRYLPSLHQLADIFTKGLPSSRFRFLCGMFNL